MVLLTKTRLVKRECLYSTTKPVKGVPPSSSGGSQVSLLYMGHLVSLLGKSYAVTLMGSRGLSEEK